MEHQGSRRIGPPQREKAKYARMPLLIYALGIAIEWAIAGMSRGGLYW